VTLQIARGSGKHVDDKACDDECHHRQRGIARLSGQKERRYQPERGKPDEDVKGYAEERGHAAIPEQSALTYPGHT
jgi:hypothetical protein